MAEALDEDLPEGLEELAVLVLRSACAEDLTLVTAESCTGGLLASLLTDLPGLSHAFERGFVTYTDDAKAEMLGVSRQILDTDGAVSEACARAMAEGALAHSRGDIAVSVTGYAGEGDPPGLVHFASARRGQPTLHVEHRFGDIGRARVRMKCLQVGLKLMRDRLFNSAVDVD